MKNVKQVSRLTGSLLARKGAAAPTRANLSMNKQALDHFSDLEDDDIVVQDIAPRQDFAVKADKPVIIEKEQEKPTVKTLEDVQNITAKKGHKRIAMTLRMEEGEHLKLKLYSAYTRESCQTILSEALDLYIEENNDKIQKLKIASRN